MGCTCYQSFSGAALQGLTPNIKEAVEAFLEEREAMGSFEEVIEEAGFEKREGQWLPRQPVAAELLSTG